MFRTLAEEGVGGFYKGVASPLVGMSTFNASLFLSYGQSKKFLLSRPGRIGDESTLTIPETYLAGAITGFCGYSAQQQVLGPAGAWVWEFRCPFVALRDMELILLGLSWNVQWICLK